MSDAETRELERRVLSGDASALPLLRAAWEREGPVEHGPDTFWVVSRFPLSIDAEPACAYRHVTPGIEYSFRHRCDSLREITALYHQLNQPVREGAHHEETHFGLFDSRRERIIHLTEGLGNGLGMRVVPGFIPHDPDNAGTSPWLRRAVARQRRLAAEILARRESGEPTPWEWFEKMMQAEKAREMW